MAAGFPETAFSRIEIWPVISDSDCAPSSGTLTLRSWPAFRAPANTICQKNDVVSLTIIGIVGLSAAGIEGTRPTTEIAPASPIRVRELRNELKSFIWGVSLL